MIFNFWRPYPFFKPKKDGWYQCSVRNHVMDLYYDASSDSWLDKRRQNVFDGYKCYKSGREPLEYNRVFTDSLCVRDDVVAWKKMPTVFLVMDEEETI